MAAGEAASPKAATKAEEIAAPSVEQVEASSEQVEAPAEEDGAAVSAEEAAIKAPERPATEEFIESAVEADAAPLAEGEAAESPSGDLAAEPAEEAAACQVEEAVAPAAEEAAPMPASAEDVAEVLATEAAAPPAEVAAPKNEVEQTASDVVEEPAAPEAEAAAPAVAEAAAPLAEKEVASPAEEAEAQVSENPVPKFSAEPDAFLVRDTNPFAAAAGASPEDVEVLISSTAKETISPSTDDANAAPVGGAAAAEVDEGAAKTDKEATELPTAAAAAQTVKEETANAQIEELTAMGFKPEEAREALGKTSSLQEAAAFLVEKYHPPATLVDRIMGWFSAPKSSDSEVFTPGRYKVCGCRMAVRSSPESTEVLEYLEDGSVMEIVEVATVSAEDGPGHVQGKMADGRWISIKSYGRLWASQISLVAQLVELGYPEAKAQEAAKRCSSIEAAVDYLS
mmetsp:Transcript_59658/g.109665  ORF Transcript_59658/g.109665 Transcript_59658/m.109665 type:complete len:455 (-) Transcript_59658:54-1418(-)